MSDETQLVEEIVNRVSERVLANISEHKSQDGNPNTLALAPNEYGIRVKSSYLYSRCYKVIGHEEDPHLKRLILHFDGGKRLAIPKLDSMSYSVYPLK